MSHELRVAGDEVLLQEPIICDDGTTALLLNPFNGTTFKQIIVYLTNTSFLQVYAKKEKAVKIAIY